MTNLEISLLLRKIAAAYQITGENRFRIIAYERAADSIGHLTTELKDLWGEGKLGEVSGIGTSIAKHLDELFTTGSVKHFTSVMAKVPASVYPLLEVPGLGPKKAYKLVTFLHLEDSRNIIGDLEKAITEHRIAPLPSFGEKSELDILESIESYKKGQIKENRMTLPVADAIATDVLRFLKANKNVVEADILGSLRRKVATIGDIDIAVATEFPDTVVDYFLTYPHQKLIERGPAGASILLHNGRQLDMRVQKPSAYGAMLQYFTGSKNHNIKLRHLALEKGLSLNEYGIKNTKNGKVNTFATERDFYGFLGLPWIPPEIREDKGEIELAAAGRGGKNARLPALIDAGDIKGDLHIHTSYDLSPSHDLGQDSLETVLDRAAGLSYEYIGISDHNPRVGNLSSAEITGIMKKRQTYYRSVHASWQKKRGTRKTVGLFIMCEVDIQPDGNLALPLPAFEYVDAVIVSVHSGFTQNRKTATGRVLAALGAHAKVRIFGHPTGRLLGKRDGIDLDWKQIFALCRERDIALEINSYPDRLDLPDNIVFDAVRAGIRFTIDTDSHAAAHMELMQYGVSVARRGWATKDDILNSLDYNNFSTWLVR